MTATFQKTLDKTLENIDNKFNFLDDILIITKGAPPRPRIRHIQSPIKTRQRTFSYQIRKMQIRKIFNHLARVQNFPIRNIPNRKKDWLDTELKTSKHT